LRTKAAAPLLPSLSLRPLDVGGLVVERDQDGEHGRWAVGERVG
jgi:hypothetical protein